MFYDEEIIGRFLKGPKSTFPIPQPTAKFRSIPSSRCNEHLYMDPVWLNLSCSCCSPPTDEQIIAFDNVLSLLRTLKTCLTHIWLAYKDSLIYQRSKSN